MLRRFTICIFSAGLIVAGAGAVYGQAFPSKPVRIVTAESGASGDLVSRVIAQALAANLGQSVIVDNRPSGAIPCDIVAKAPPDGYTMLHFTNSTWTLPLMQRATYDPIRDFAPVTLTVKSVSVLVVHPSLPLKSVADLIAYAKARPGDLNYASGGTGGAGHLSAELFKSMAEVDLVRIHYKGGGPALNALLGNQVQLGFLSAGSVIPHVKSGRLRALAVSGPQRSALLPEVPTVAESGFPGYEDYTWIAAFAPAGTPRAIVDTLNTEIDRVLRLPDVKERLAVLAFEYTPNTPPQFAEYVRKEVAKWGKVVKSSGARVD